MNSILEALFGETYWDKQMRYRHEQSQWAGMSRIRCPECGQFFGVEATLAEKFLAREIIIHRPNGDRLRARRRENDRQ